MTGNGEHRGSVRTCEINCFACTIGSANQNCTYV